MYRRDPSEHLLTIIQGIEQTLQTQRQLIEGLTQEKNDLLQKFLGQQQQIDGLTREKNDILQKFAAQQQQIEDLKQYKHDIFHKSQEEKKETETEKETEKETDKMVVFKIFKHIESIAPSSEMVHFKPIEVSAGSYIAEATMTYINRTLVTDSGLVLGLYRVNRKNNSEDLLVTGSAGWFGKVQGSDQYSARQTVSVKTNIVVNERREMVELFIKPVGMRNVSPVLHDPSSPCVLTLF